MKKLNLICFLLLLSQLSFAQKYFARAAIGYGFPLSNSRPVYLTGFPYTGGNPDPNDNALFVVKKASMFSGVRGTAALGIMFNKIGFEVGATSVLGNVSYSFTQSLAIYPPGSETTITQSVKYPVILTPSLVMKVPGRSVDVLLRAGLALPVSKKIFMDGVTKSGPNTFRNHSELKTYFGTGLSFSGGGEYKITKALRAFLTVDILVMTVKARELKLVNAVANGEDITASLFAYERSTLFVDDLGSYTFSSDQPRKAQTYSIPFGTKGFSVGVYYQL